MGFVMTVCMLLGILLLAPWPPVGVGQWHRRPALARAMAMVVLLAGVWNALWHGLRNLNAFWGIAALVSGLLMIAAAALVLRRVPTVMVDAAAPSSTVLRGAVLVGLLASFLLYAITLLRLNLGYRIIGQ